MSKSHTPGPWEVHPPRKGDGGAGPHDWVIVGNVCESEDTADDDGPSCVVVAHVKGNPTSGGIPRANADRIVRAVNDHDRLIYLLAALTTERKTGRKVLTELESVALDELFAQAQESAQ